MSVFQFKKFSIEQGNCAMKVNTDGVLLGALAEPQTQDRILDIGTGTGLIALMCAQRFPHAEVDALEIEREAAATADFNFRESPFSERLHCYNLSFQDFGKSGKGYAARYDAILSNPPFFIGSLKNPEKGKEVARHAGPEFFYDLLDFSAASLTMQGELVLILPPATAAFVKRIAGSYSLFLSGCINLRSFKHSEAHRQILTFKAARQPVHTSDFVIYEEQKKYSADYVTVLRDFFTIF